MGVTNLFAGNEGIVGDALPWGTYAIPLTAVGISLITLVFGLLTLRQKAGEQEMQLLHTALLTRIQLLETDLAAIRATEAECQRERRQLQQDFYALSRQLAEYQSPRREL